MTENTIDVAASVNTLIDRHGATEAGLWRAILDRARTCPQLRRVVDNIEAGDFTRAQALMLMGLAASFEAERNQAGLARAIALLSINGQLTTEQVLGEIRGLR